MFAYLHEGLLMIRTVNKKLAPLVIIWGKDVLVETVVGGLQSVGRLKL